MQRPLQDLFGRPGWPKPQPPDPLVMRVSVWDGTDWPGRPLEGRVRLDKAIDEPARPLLIGTIEDGRLRFPLPPDAAYGWHAELTVIVRGMMKRFDITLASDVEIDMVPAVVAPIGTVRTGVVQSDRKAIFDGMGKFTGRGATWFWALQAWMADGAERDRLKRNADWWDAQHRRPDFFRILCEVGTSGNPTSSWTGLEIDWTQPKWKAKGQETLAQLMDFFYKEHGVRLELTILGKGSNTDPVWLSNLVADVVADGRQHMVMDIEMVNESGSGTKVSIATMKQMAAIFKAKVPNILALSSPMETAGAWEDMEAAAKALGLKGFSEHFRRKMLDKGWGYVRQGYDAKNTDLVLLNNEPAGHASSDGGLTDPLLLAMTVAVSTACGAATYVAHTGTGVYGNGKPHATAGARPANFNEIPNYDAQLEAQWRVLDLIPVGVQNWAVRNTQRAGVPFDLPESMHWGTGYENSSGFGVNKAYAAVSPSGVFIQLPCGVKMAGDKPCQMTAQFAMTDVTVFDPLTREPVPSLGNLSFGVGDKLPVPARADGMTASIIRGEKA